MHGVIFKTCKFASFVRNLNKHGFRKTNADGNHIHKCFPVDKAEKHSSGSWVYFKHPYYRQFDQGYVHQSRIIVVPPLRMFAPPLIPLDESDTLPPTCPLMMPSRKMKRDQDQSRDGAAKQRNRAVNMDEEGIFEPKRPKTDNKVGFLFIERPYSWRLKPQ